MSNNKKKIQNVEEIFYRSSNFELRLKFEDPSLLIGKLSGKIVFKIKLYILDKIFHRLNVLVL